jgi:hypothetical protein
LLGADRQHHQEIACHYNSRYAGFRHAPAGSPSCLSQPSFNLQAQLRTANQAGSMFSSKVSRFTAPADWHTFAPCRHLCAVHVVVADDGVAALVWHEDQPAMWLHRQLDPWSLGQQMPSLQLPPPPMPLHRSQQACQHEMLSSMQAIFSRQGMEGLMLCAAHATAVPTGESWHALDSNF